MLSSDLAIVHLVGITLFDFHFGEVPIAELCSLGWKDLREKWLYVVLT